MKTVTIQGVEIPLREMSCVCDNKASPRGDSVNITVNTTNQCPYSCPFCCNPVRTGEYFDYKAFARFFVEVIRQTNVGKVTFTGGELGLNCTDLGFALQFVKAVSDAQTVVCTSGFFLQQERCGFEHVDNISLSRHHYDNKRHARLMTEITATVIRESTIAEHEAKSKINFSCNLIKGYIDSEAEIYKYLEWAESIGIHDVAFVGLMPVNDWCKTHFVDPKNFVFNNNVMEYAKWEFPIKQVCECNNYVYTCKNGNIVKFYIRHCLNPCYEKGSFIMFKDNKIQTRY